MQTGNEKGGFARWMRKMVARWDEFREVLRR